MAQKTVNLIIAEAKQEIINTLNKSNLPISILEIVLGQVYNDVVSQSRATLEQEVKAYQEEVAKEQEVEVVEAPVV